MARKQEFSIETVKKYYFWVVVPLGLITALFVTMGTVAKITADFKARTTALENTKRSTETIRNENNHPNDNTIKQIQDFTVELENNVNKAWEHLKRDQDFHNYWPPDVGPRFNEEIKDLRFGDEISYDSRVDYLNFINKYVPQLEIDVDRRRLQEKDKDGNWVERKSELVEMSGGASGGATGREVSSSGSMSVVGGSANTGVLDPSLTLPPNLRIVGVVDWDKPEPRALVDHWQTVRQSVDIWYTQEDFWIYKALLGAISRTNSGATAPHNAWVKRIDSFLIGRAASQVLAERSMAGNDDLVGSDGSRTGSGMGGLGASGPGGAPSGSSSLSGSGSMSSGSGTGGAPVRPPTPEEIEAVLKDFRYVDDKANPLAAGTKAPFNEFKRMPVFMRLIVDQRRIPELLVNCANSEMPIEVLWIRINPEAMRPFDITSYTSSNIAGGGVKIESAAAGTPRSASSTGSAVPGSTTPSTGMGGRSEEGSMSAFQQGGTISSYGTETVTIEIYGVITIFNSVDESTLHKTTEAK